MHLGFADTYDIRGLLIDEVKREFMHKMAPIWSERYINTWDRYNCRLREIEEWEEYFRSTKPEIWGFVDSMVLTVKELPSEHAYGYWLEVRRAGWITSTAGSRACIWEETKYLVDFRISVPLLEIFDGDFRELFEGPIRYWVLALWKKATEEGLVPFVPSRVWHRGPIGSLVGAIMDTAIEVRQGMDARAAELLRQLMETR